MLSVPRRTQKMSNIYLQKSINFPQKHLGKDKSMVGDTMFMDRQTQYQKKSILLK